MSKNIININSISNISTNKAIIWTKVSALEQRRGRSLQAQIIDTQEYCYNKGFEILKEYSDTENGRAGDTLKFRELIKFIKQQNEPVNIIVQSLDRLHREERSFTKIYRLKDRGKIIIHSVEDVNTNTEVCLMIGGLIFSYYDKHYKPRKLSHETLFDNHKSIES
jgi:DNA invertase Pin-like site-specific DNA recombinase